MKRLMANKIIKWPSICQKASSEIILKILVKIWCSIRNMVQQVNICGEDTRVRLSMHWLRKTGWVQREIKRRPAIATEKRNNLPNNEGFKRVQLVRQTIISTRPTQWHLQRTPGIDLGAQLQC